MNVTQQTMSSTSSTQQSGVRACVSPEILRGIFIQFTQRRFESLAKTCESISSGTNKDHGDPSCVGGDDVETNANPFKLYRFSENKHNVSRESETSGDTLPATQSIDYPVARHSTGNPYNTESEGVASRVSDKVTDALSWTDAAGEYHLTNLDPSLEWTRRTCTIGGGQYNQKTARSFVGTPSARGFGYPEIACETCAVDLKSFAETFHEGCTNASIRSKSDGELYATIRGAGSQPEHPYDFDVPLARAEYLHHKSHKETHLLPCTVPKCKMSLVPVVSMPTRRSTVKTRERTRKRSV